jgi:hypothetical protein
MNNPLNIEFEENKPWKGEVRPSQDYKLAQFRTMAYGFRAAFKMLYNYQYKHGCKQLEDFISRIAPPSTNNTREYVDFVSNRCRISDITTINTKDERMMISLVTAIARKEMEEEPQKDDVQEGWNLFKEDFL